MEPGDSCHGTVMEPHDSLLKRCCWRLGLLSCQRLRHSSSSSSPAAAAAVAEAAAAAAVAVDLGIWEPPQAASHQQQQQQQQLQQQQQQQLQLSHHVGEQLSTTTTLGLAPTPVAHQTAWKCLGPRTCTNKVIAKAIVSTTDGATMTDSTNTGDVSPPFQDITPQPPLPPPPPPPPCLLLGRLCHSALPGPIWHGLKLPVAKYNATRPPPQQQPWRVLRLQNPCPSWSPWPALPQPPCQHHHPGRLEASNSPPSSGSGETCTCHRYDK